MVKTKWTKGRKKKLPIRRPPISNPEITHPPPEIDPPCERMNDDISVEGANVCGEERDNGGEEERDNGGEEEELLESESSVSVNGDDCSAINEDAAGYREAEPELAENAELDNETFVNVEICSDDVWLSQFGDVREDEPEDGAEDANDSGDDIWNDDIIPDPLSDDDGEEEVEDRSFNCRPDEILALGKCFNNADEFKYALLRYSLKTEYDIHMYKSSNVRFGAKCTQHIKEKCPWRVYCSFEKSRNKLMVKVFVDEHICARSGTTKLLNSGAIAQLFEERLRINPKIKSQEMVDEVKREYNMIVSVDQCRRAKYLLTRKRKASYDSHFARLWDYQAEVKRSNRGSTMEIETIPGPVPGSKQRFLHIYICFAALRNAWKQSCRPIIGLDAAFMKWDIKGQMLAAVGRVGDNRIFLIAWAVVDVEDNPNWLWFVQLLKKDLELQDGDNITIISDKHKGILNAVHVELPRAEHRMCSRHIVENWKKTHKDIELERMFWKIARSYTPEAFEDNLEALEKYNLSAYESLQSTGPKTWSRAFFKVGSCCNDNLNNLSESFNRNVRESRKKPLLDFLTEVRRKVMERNASRTVIINRWKKRFTQRADREIESNRQKARECIRYRTTRHVHEIDFHGDAWSVDMDQKTCGCCY